MTILKAIPQRTEVPCRAGGKLAYRWATRYVLVNPGSDRREFPAVTRGEVYARARELGATIEFLSAGAI